MTRIKPSQLNWTISWSYLAFPVKLELLLKISVWFLTLVLVTFGLWTVVFLTVQKIQVLLVARMVLLYALLLVPLIVLLLLLSIETVQILKFIMLIEVRQRVFEGTNTLSIAGTTISDL